MHAILVALDDAMDVDDDLAEDDLADEADQDDDLDDDEEEEEEEEDEDEEGDGEEEDLDALDDQALDAMLRGDDDAHTERPAKRARLEGDTANTADPGLLTAEAVPQSTLPLSTAPAAVAAAAPAPAAIATPRGNMTPEEQARLHRQLKDFARRSHMKIARIYQLYRDNKLHTYMARVRAPSLPPSCSRASPCSG